MLKVVILAGGHGTRLAEAGVDVPKPMVRVGGQPLLWHIMKIYAHHGFAEFIVALGHRGDVVREFFVDAAGSGVSGLGTDHLVVERPLAERWRVHLVETGADTATGGRLLQLAPLLSAAPFMVTYGDGLADVDVRALVSHHRERDHLATLTAVRPPQRFGRIILAGAAVSEFAEKRALADDWINGGFMVVEPEALADLHGPASVLELDLLEPLARAGRLGAYRHRGFWQCIDTPPELQAVRALWASGAAPWAVWEEVRGHGHAEPV